MQVWNVLHTATSKRRPQKIAKNSPSGHNRTTLSGYIFVTKTCIVNRKKILNSNISPTCPHNMVNFGPLTAEIRSGVWGIPTNFNGFRVLAPLLHGKSRPSGRQPNCGVEQTARRHLYSARRPSRWALAHILVLTWNHIWNKINFFDTWFHVDILEIFKRF